MDYSDALLTTVADCDQLLLMAEARLRTLRQRELVTGYQRENKELSATDLTAELTALNAEVDHLTGLLAILPASDTRVKRENDLRRATDRRDELVSRQGAVGAVALLTRELDQGETAARITELEAFEAVVTARRAAL